jgi:hypothetical protein
VPNVNISTLGAGAQSNNNGFYSLTAPANKKIVLVFTHISFKGNGFIDATVQ